MKEEMVERLAAVVARTAHAIDDFGAPLIDNPEEVAHACLAEIEAQGMVIVPREPPGDLPEAAAHSWRIMMSLAAAPKQG